MHAPSATDFYVEVEPLGTFTFAKRTMRDELRIMAEVSRLTEGLDNPTTELRVLAGYIAPLKVLTVKAPEGWDIDTMDPLDQSVYDNIVKVFHALRDKESSFRPGATPPGQAVRPTDSKDNGVLVSKEIQPGANGPAVS